jgi:hypothetical protein
VIALLAEVHLETLHRLAQLPARTRVGVVSVTPETAHNLEHSIANAGLPNIVFAGSCPAEGAALARLVRRVDVIVCSTPAVERVRRLVGSPADVIVDDRALDRRAVEMLAAILVRHDGDGAPLSELPVGQRVVARAAGQTSHPRRRRTGDAGQPGRRADVQEDK